MGFRGEYIVVKFQIIWGQNASVASPSKLYINYPKQTILEGSEKRFEDLGLRGFGFRV